MKASKVMRSHQLAKVKLYIESNPILYKLCRSLFFSSPKLLQQKLQVILYKHNFFTGAMPPLTKKHRQDPKQLSPRAYATYMALKMLLDEKKRGS